MADDSAEMLAMMQQMQAGDGGGGGGGPPPAGPAGGPRHKKRQSNVSLSMISLQSQKPVVDAQQEIEDLRAEKDLLLQAYEKIDLDDNGDIEYDEFEQGMQRFNVSLTDQEVQQVFKLMDSDASDFIDRTEFTMFLTQRFESQELTRFQDAILRKLGGRTRRSIAGALTTEAIAEVDDVALANEARMMRQQIMDMNNDEMRILEEQQTLLQQLETAEDEKEEFGAPEQAADWNRFEVAHWLDAEVHLNEYMTGFLKGHVDGSILLSDMSRDFLVMELGVKMVHVEKILRAIQALRDRVRTEWDESDCFDVVPYPIMNDERAVDTIAALQAAIAERDEEMDNLRKEYEARIKALCDSVEEKETIIEKAKRDGFIVDDGDKENSDASDVESVDSADVEVPSDDEDMPELVQVPEYTMEPQQTAVIHDSNLADVEEEEDEEEEQPNADPAANDAVNPTDEPAADDDADDADAAADGDDDAKGDDATESFEIIPSASLSDTKSREELSIPSVTDTLASTSPNLTPSAQQVAFSSAKSSPRMDAHAVQSMSRKAKHHRRNSTKKGFWNDTPNKKKPPAGTKAYWLYLEQKYDSNANFADPQRVRQWHHHEIAWWLKQIKCEKYAVKFVEEKVSGEQLIQDMSTGVLSSDLGIKMLHCGKIMREIKSLRIHAGLEYAVDEGVNTFVYKPSDEESASKRLEAAQTLAEEAAQAFTTEIAEQTTKMDELRQENEELRKENERVEAMCAELNKRKPRADDDDSDDDDDDDDEEDEEPVLQTKQTTQPPLGSRLTEPIETTDMREFDAQAVAMDQDATDEHKEETAATSPLDVDAPDVADVDVEAMTSPLLLPTDKIVVTKDADKHPKGYWRKYPKEIRKLMREIDEMQRKSNRGDYGEQNRGKFAAVNRAHKWHTHEVCSWLDSQGFMAYIASFFENGIDGEILVNDLNPKILHEDLKVKRFHCGKMLREIQVVRQGGEFTACENVVDVGYEAAFSAAETLVRLQDETTALQQQLTENSEKVEELLTRPAIKDTQKIIEIQEWEQMESEKERLARQVDEYEEKIEDIKNTQVPEQQKAEAQETQLALLATLETKQSENENFGLLRNAAQWEPEEVCWFFHHTIGLSDYSAGILEQNINGSILLYDTSPEMLSRDIGVKRIHINQVMREVHALKQEAFGYDEDDAVTDVAYVPDTYATEQFAAFEDEIEQLTTEIETREQMYAELEQQYSTLGEEKQTVILEKEQCLKQIEELQQNISDLQQQQQQELEQAAQTQIESLQAEIETLTQTVADNAAGHETQKLATTEEHAQVVEDKETQIADLTQKIEDLDTTLADATLKIEEFEDRERHARELEEAKDNSYQAELRRTAENDATFGVPKRAHKWSIQEVSFWLFTIKIPDYVDSFREKLVDGSILLSDLSTEQLRTELQIKQYHIGKITREIAKLKELALPPLYESDFVCDAEYVPNRPATALMHEMTQDLRDQNDINSALKMEVTRIQQQLQTMEEIVSISRQEEHGVTAGGPDHGGGAELKEDVDVPGGGAEATNSHSEQLQLLQKENQELNDLLMHVTVSKNKLAVNTAEEMQKLRRMVMIASKAYEELTGTPLGQVAQWQSTQNFFYNTLGYNGNGNSKQPRRSNKDDD